MERKQPLSSGFAGDNVPPGCSINVGSSAPVSIYGHLYLAIYSTFDGSTHIMLLIMKTIATHQCLGECDLLRLLAFLHLLFC